MEHSVLYSANFINSYCGCGTYRFRRSYLWKDNNWGSIVKNDHEVALKYVFISPDTIWSCRMLEETSNQLSCSVINLSLLHSGGHWKLETLGFLNCKNFFIIRKPIYSIKNNLFKFWLRGWWWNSFFGVDGDGVVETAAFVASKEESNEMVANTSFDYFDPLSLSTVV